MKPALDILARTLLAAVFLVSSIRQIMGFAVVSAMMARRGFPVPEVFLVLAIILEIAGGLMLILNWNARYAALALAAFTLAAGSIFHGFWTVWAAPPPEFNNEFNHFLKNMAIVGGLLLIAASRSDDKVQWSWRRGKISAAS
jgi:putative oxidoreductase